MRRSSTLTPISPVSASSRASSPGWSGTATKTVVSAREGPPCLAGITAVPATPRSRTSVSRDRSPSSSAPSRASTSSRTSSSSAVSASVLAVTICCHSSGSPAATRVTSRTPCPDSARCSRGASVSRPAATAASRCGRCEVRATAWSCSAGEKVTGVAPHSRASSVTCATASGRRGVVRGDRPGPAVEQRRRRRERPGPLAAGHRVAADVATDVLRGQRRGPRRAGRS